MGYEILKIIVFVFGPVAVYAALRATLEIPELVTALPTAVRRAIEAVGAMYIIGAWFVAGVVPFSNAMVVIGLVLLATPFVARKLSQSRADYLEA
jgi:hypothetical protein